jgi:hypothetical protein
VTVFICKFYTEKAVRVKIKRKETHGSTLKKMFQPVTRRRKREGNRKVKTEDFSIIDPYEMETILEEEDMEDLT